MGMTNQATSGADALADLTGLDALVVILIAAFGLDRIVSALLFGLSYNKGWQRLVPDPQGMADPVTRLWAEKQQKLAYFALATVLALIVVSWGHLRILSALGLTDVNTLLDIVMTALILVAGADRISEIAGMTKGGPGGKREGPRPIEINGTLVLEDGAARQATAREGESVRPVQH